MTHMLRFIPLLLLMSCANVQSTTLNQEGKQVHKLTCSEFNTSQQDCRAKAQTLCAEEPQRISHIKEEFPDAGDGFYMHARHHYTVECKS